MDILLAGSEWGVPPWDITGENPTPAVKMRWFFRWQSLAEQRAVKNKKDIEEWQRS